MAIKICIAGATGWAGSALSKGVSNDSDLELLGGISRSGAGKDLADILELELGNIPVFSTVKSALEELKPDVFVEYTKPNIAKNNVLIALDKGCNVVIGTSGLTDADYAEIEEKAIQLGRSVLAVGNFAITAVLLQKFSEMAAKYIPNFEIIDYASARKKDAPSGTVRELANRLSKVRESKLEVPIEEVVGEQKARGARLGGVQIHAVRLPGHILGVESIFGLQDEKLTIRHDAGGSAEPYVQGAILAIKKVGTFTGLKRGLDSVMEF